MSQWRVADLALPFQIVLSYLTEFSISRSISKFFWQNAIVKNRIQMQQIIYVHGIAEVKYNIPISINTLMKIFDYSRNSLKSALEHDLELLENRWKHIAFDQQNEKQIFDWIGQNTESGRSVTKKKTKITPWINFKLQSLETE
jgi:hypothetical protein